MSEPGRESIDGAVSSSGVTWSVDTEGIALVTFDTPGSRVNLLTLEALMALEEAAGFLERRDGLRGVVLTSAKPSTFIAGADVTQIASVASGKEALGKSMAGQRVFGMFEKLATPVVAAINGACLGGGLELALACTARIAADAGGVQLGLPEVKLGIIPGWGGTQRLPRLLALPIALDMILTGRTLPARRALRAGLVDAVAPPERLLAEARRIAKDLSGLSRAQARERLKPASAWTGMARRAPIRSFVLSRAGSAVRRRTGGRYPAPAAAIEAIGTGLARGMEAGLAREAEKVADLVTGSVARNLIGIFLASREPVGVSEEPVLPVRRIGILGAGTMGGGIAAAALGKGIAVRLRDVAPEPLEKGVAHAHAILARQGRRRKDPSWAPSRMAALAPALSLAGMARVDLVIEAVVENLSLKRRVLAELEREVDPACILASNTSSLSIGELASALERPGRLVGMHFFNPAERMPLVEIVRGERSDPEAVAATAALARKLGKTPVVVGDSPGFVVNRLLMPYLAEALRVLEEGGPIGEVDRTLVRFGMPMGPFALLDQIGIDVAAHVAGVLASAFGERLPSPRALAAVAASGHLGVKSGSGFYEHKGKRPEVNAKVASLVKQEGGGAAGVSAPSGEALVRRLLYPVINEAARVLEEGVATGPESVDLAMVFGTGFPPFLGGPLRWADTLGLPAIVEALGGMASASGSHLEPSQALIARASSPGRFHEN